MTQGPDSPLTPPPVPASLASLLGQLRHCPHCQYDLTGLPRNHRCPECGQPYDDFMLELRLAVSRGAWILVPAISALAVAGPGSWIGSRLINWSSVWASLWYEPAVVALGGVLGGAILWVSRCGRCYITTTGLIRAICGRNRTISWHMVCIIEVIGGLFFDREIQIGLRLPRTRVVQRARLPVSCSAAAAKDLVEYLRKYRDFALAHSRNVPAA